ncbi:DUF2523 family protein [Vibrio splendidus]
MLDWFAQRWNDFLDLCLSVLLSLWDMFNDLICYVLESAFNVVYLIVNGISGAFSSFGLVQYLSMLPNEMLNIMSLVGANEASAIIVSAVVVRVILQLIPFVRLGS